MSPSVRFGERLTPVDAAWMRMDEPTNPMMTTGVVLLDAPLERARLTRVFRRVVALHPRFAKRIVTGPRGPRWVDDPGFDVRIHVRAVPVEAPGDGRALRALVARTMSSPLVAEGLTWTVDTVEGIADGRGALIFRVQHSVADGPALLHVMADLTDAHPGGHRRGDARAYFASHPALARGSGPIFGRPGRSGVPALMSAVAQAASGLGRLLGTVTGPSDKATALRGVLGASKAGGWTEPIALSRFRPIRRVTGATVNDILLSCTAGALRRHLVAAGGDVDGLVIRAMVPVNLTALSGRVSADAGNHVGLVYVPLPVGVEDPFARLHETRRLAGLVKASGEAPVSYTVLGAIGLLPPAIVGPTLAVFGSRATVVITNVPGPGQARYLAGRRIDRIVFFVPQAARLGLGVSLMSYAGSVIVGIGADTGIVGDPQLVAAAVEDEFCALENEIAGTGERAGVAA